MEKKFGLIGQSLDHSLSKDYFDEKFFRENLIDCHFDLYEIENIGMLKPLLEKDKKIYGLTITMPYKEQIIGLLNKIDKTAKIIGAVNVIKIKNGKINGYNTDSDAFTETLVKWFPKSKDARAIVLGTGGVSKAVQYALKKLKIKFKLISHRKQSTGIGYDKLKDSSLLEESNLIINATPVGMFPHTTEFPPVPYEQLNTNHFVYDLIYNPARTLLLQKAEMRGAHIKNGLEMLHVQAEKAWKIWKG